MSKGKAFTNAEAFYDALIENNEDLIAFTDKNFKIIYRSPSVLRITGWNSEETVKAPWIEHIHPADKEMLRTVMEEVLANPGKRVPVSFSTKHKAGHYISMQGVMTNLLDNENIHGIVVNLKDITERITSEDNLQRIIKEISDYKFALDESSIVAITDQKGIIKHANDNFCKISKFTRDELVGQDHRIINSGYHTKKFIRDLWVTIANGKIWRGEFKNKAKDGTIYWVDTTIVPFLNMQGKPYQYLSIRSDITPRKSAHEKLKQSESSLKEAQQIAHVGNWEIDILNNKHDWSDEFYNIFGIEEKDDFIPSMDAFFSFIHPDDLEFASTNMKNSFSTRTDSGFNFRFVKRNGEIGYAYGESRYDVDQNNKPLRVYGIVKDITEQKNLEDERAKMVADIVQRNKNLEQFSYIVSHNLRMPVANIIGFTDVLKSGNLPKETEAELNEGLSVSVKKLDEVIEDLNYILQVKKDVNDKKELVKFSQLTEDIYVSIKTLIEKDKAVIVWDFSEVDEMLTFKSYLNSIFYNLISNSLKYRQPNIPSLIEIKSQKLNDKIILLFKDNGMGIDLERKADQVFGLYKRFHTDKAEGKGMGLFMVKTQVETIGGRISITSEVNKGTEFKIVFEVDCDGKR